MTNTNRTLPKWLCYSGAFLFCFFLERCVCNALPLWHAVPLLAPLTAAAVGFLEGAEEGAAFGMGAGLLCAVCCGAGNARMIWLLSLSGALCGLTLHRSLGRTLPGYLLCAVGTMGLVEMVSLLLRLGRYAAPAAAMLPIAAGEAAYSLLFAPAVYLLFSAIYRRFRPDLEFDEP
jgi:hypothetical protein